MKLLPSRNDLRVESEEGQASFRLNAALVALAAYGLASLASPSIVGTTQLACVFAYVCYAYVWAWLVRLRAGSTQPRQWGALVLDHIVFGVCFGLGGRAVAALAWVSVTTSVGHGLRFGEARGIAASLAGGIAIFAAMAFGPGWHIAPSVTLGTTMTALIAPIYVTRLVHAIQAQRKEVEARAATLEQAVHTDALTGVLSRRGFEAAWAGLADSSGLSKVAIGLVYIDLDGFKAINDISGHDVGDEVLRQVGTQLSTTLRNSDVVARMGGDEFVILVRGPSRLEDVEEVASKAVAGIVHWSGTSPLGVKLGASAGAMFAPSGISLGAALRSADERMFAVKRERKALTKSHV